MFLALSCILNSPTTSALGAQSPLVPYIVVAPSTKSQLAVDGKTKELKSGGLKLDWKIDPEGSLSGITEAGVRVHVCSDSDVLAGYHLKTELFRMRSKETKISGHRFSELTPGSQERVRRHLALTLPYLDLNPSSRFVVSVQTASSIRFPKAAFMDVGETRRASKEYALKFPYNPERPGPDAFDIELADALAGGELKATRTNQEALEYRAMYQSKITADRFELNPLFTKPEQLSQLSFGLLEVKTALERVLDDLDQKILAALAPEDKFRSFYNIRRSKTVEELSTADNKTFQDLRNQVESNFKFFGYESARAATEALPRLSIKTGTVSGIYIFDKREKRPVLLDLWNVK